MFELCLRYVAGIKNVMQQDNKMDANNDRCYLRG